MEHVSDTFEGGARAVQSTDLNPLRMRDVLGRVKVAMHQNIYEADFEYGPQPLRWESFTVGGASITHMPNLGGVRMRLSTASGDITIRQSRPYNRYQPGKTMFMASAVNFGALQTGQVQRVGFFDDSNGCFFEENGQSVGVVFRSDISGTPVDTRVESANFSHGANIYKNLDWTRIQMIFIEYAWYGAGAIRWGVFINGEPFILHQIGFGNRSNQTYAWARTGNLPVRYEQRNLTAVAAQNDMIHFGVSVCVEGRVDDQRGFTYSYGMDRLTPRRTVPANSVRYPVLSIRGRVMGTQEYTQASSAITAGTSTSLTVTGTPWTVDQWKGRMVAYGAAGATPNIARITGNTSSALTIADNITGLPVSVVPAAGNNYTIGLANRGQLLPRQLLISASALAVVEVIVSAPGNPVVLTGGAMTSLSTLGSANSFAERDVTATSMSGGEVVMAFTAPAGGSGLQTIDLSNLFPLLNTIRGNLPDILCLAVSTPSASSADVGAHFICQEAMS